MKKQLLFVSLLAMLFACQTEATSSIISSSTSNSSSVVSESSVEESSSLFESESSVEESSSSVESSDEVSSSEESSVSSSEESSSSVVVVDAKKKSLDALRSGFDVQTVYSKQYNNGTPTNYRYRDLIKDGVVRSIYYKGEWESINKLTQYEEGTNDEAFTVSYDINGNVVYTPLLLVDPIVNQDVEALWSESRLVNAFTLLSDDDFTLDEETRTVSLTITEEKLADDDFSYALSCLSAQLYLSYEGYNTHYFIDGTLESFSFVLSEDNLPTTYSAKFFDKTQDDGWGGVDTVKISYEGQFLAFGEDVNVSKIVKLEDADSELNSKLQSLLSYNFNATFKRTTNDDWYGSYVDGQGSLTSDGKGTLEITKGTGSSATFVGYRQLDDANYRKYSLTDDVYTYTGESIAGTLTDGIILPLFSMNSYFFEKDETNSTETKTVFNYIGHELLTTKPTTSIFCGFDNTINNTQPLDKFTVTFEGDKVSFVNVVGSFTTEVEFTEVNKVTEINRTII